MREYVCQIRGKESINKNGSFNWMIKLDFYDFFYPYQLYVLKIHYYLVISFIVASKMSVPIFKTIPV